MGKFTWQQEEDFMKASLDYSIDNAMDWIRGNLEPEDVFTEGQLEEWASTSGYVKE